MPWKRGQTGHVQQGHPDPEPMDFLASRFRTIYTHFPMILL